MKQYREEKKTQDNIAEYFSNMPDEVIERNAD